MTAPLVNFTPPEEIRENYNSLLYLMGRRKNSGKILPPEKKEAIINAINDGKKNPDIVREVHCAPKTVRDIREKIERGDLK